MDKLAINILENHFHTPFGLIKINDFTFQNNMDILQKNQDIIYKLIKTTVNRKIIEKDLQSIAPYQSNIIWLFDKDTIVNQIVEEEKRNITEFGIIIVGFFISVAVLFYLYKKNYFIGICIYLILLVTLIGSYIAYQKFIGLNKKKHLDLQHKELIDKNTKSITNFINIIEEIYHADLFLSIKKHIKDPLYILKNILDQPNAIYQISRNREKYSRIFTKVLEYIGILDIFITLSKQVIYNNYSLPEYVQAEKPYIEIVGDTYLKLGDESTNIMYIVGNFEKRNNYIEHLLKNIYMAQSIGITDLRKLKYTPFYAIIDQPITEIPNVMDTLKENQNNIYLVVLTFTHEMNHYFLELLNKLVKIKNMILILSIEETIKELEIDKFIIKEF